MTTNTTIVRSIYFFTIPDYIETPVVDYILVVLPTFFFFTTFSLIVVIWAVAVLKKVSSDPVSLQRSVERVGLSVNIVLYLLFISVVVAFQYSANESSSIECGGRILSESSNNTQRTISLVYAILIAVISLIIGIGFLYFGFKLNTFFIRRGSSRKVKMHIFSDNF